MKRIATPGWFRRGPFALVVALVAPVAHAGPGDLDTSFGTGGTALFTAAPGASLAVALRPGGAGYVLAGSAVDAGGVSRFELIALLANGGVDTAFGGTGRIVLDQRGVAHAVAFDPSGRILLAGESDAGIATIVRVLSDGTPDATFGTDGSLEADPTLQGASRVRAVAVQSDGKILHAGRATSGGKGFAYVARLKEDGSLDGTFANGSSFITLGSDSEFRGLALQPDGKIVAAGYTTIAADKGLFAVRLLADGTLDPSFLGTGQFTLGGGGVDIRANAVALMPGGRIAIFGRSVDGRSAGGTQTGVFGARLDPDGQLMGSLALALLSDLPTENGEALAVAAQSDGRLLVAGRTLAGALFVARLLPSTLLVDRSFGVNGYVVSSDFASAANGLVHEPALGRAVLAVGAVPQGSGGVAMQASSPASIVVYQAGQTLQAGTPGTYTVTLVNATGAPVSGFSFGPISVGDPSIVLAATPTTDCPGTVTGAIGSNTISFAGTGAPLADKASCTITVSLVGSSTVSSAWEFPVGSVTSDGGFANLAPSYYAMFVQGGVDTTPDAFSFAPALGVAAGSEVTSGAVTISGITGPAPISVANGSYSIGCTATYVTTPGTIANGQTVCVRHFASSSPGGTIATTLTVGGVSGSFLSTAVGGQSGVDTTPDPFAFTNVSGVPVSVIFFNVTVTSNAVTISGITGPAPISVVNGSYAIGCTDPFVSTPGTITNGQSVCVRHRSATTPGGTVTTTLTIGGVSATFTSTTSLRAQTINSAPLGESAVGAPPTRLFAFASSGLPVVFNSTTPAVCTVGASTSATESTATMLSAGTCTITVDQPGGAGFAPAPQLVSSLLVKEAVSVNDIVSIAASVDQTCAVTMSGAVKCWGLVLQPVPGRTDKNAVTPIDVTGLSGPVTMAAPGRTLACARTTSGRVECWGTNSFGELGIGTSGPDSSSLVPVAPIGLSGGVGAVFAWSYGACALTTTGGVRCWGENSRGVVGNGTAGPPVTSPVDVVGLTSGVSAITGFCALTTSGGVKCWGPNDFGSLGDGTGISSTTPVNVSGLSSGVVAISGSCALTTRGLVKCWGPNDKGQVGDGTLTDRYEPADVVGLASDVAAIAAGGNHTCALTTGGGVKCWGNNEFGQLGDGTQTNRLTPVDVIGLASDVVAIAAGAEHTCVLMKTGGVKCWGRSAFGRLGIGDSPGSIVPADVVGLDGFNRRPDPFAFQGVSGVPAGSTVTSNLVTINGIEVPSPIAVTNGSYSIGCTGVFVTTPGTVANGQMVCVRHAASAFDFTTTTTTLVVGGYSSSFSSQTGTRPSLTLSPTRLDYASRAVGSASATQVVTVTNTGLSPATGLQWGVNADFQVTATTCTASLAVGASCPISITFTPLAPGERADELLVFSTSPVTVVRAVLYGFGVATDVVPNVFAFTDQFVVPMSTVITSAPVQVTGLTGAAPVSVANGSYCVSATNSCSSYTFRQDPSTITDGQYLCARHTSSPVPGGQVDTLVFVGGLGDAFTSITIDTVPAAFGFPAVSGVQPATTQASAAAAITGINAPSPVSVSGGEYSVGCTGTWTSTAGTVTNGQTVCVRHVAAGSYSASNTTTLTIGGVTGSFVTTTAPATSIPRLGNISTRMQVLTGNDVLIGGFIIGGTQAKTVVVRARGPSLAPFGITNFLANPQLQLYSGQTVIAANDDWGTATNAAALTATGFAPENAREAAILTTLAPGAYTAIVSGVGGTTGVGIVEVFEVDLPEVPLANISTRGSVLTGNDVMIGGFIIQGDAPQTVIVRARGPSLGAFGIANPLANPLLQIFSGQAQIAMNDNWQESADAAQIQSRGFAPANAFESAILITLNPGAYTAIVTGAGGATGVGIIEVFAQ